MRYVKFVVAVLVFLASAGLPVRGQESRQETAPAVNRDTGSDASETLKVSSGSTGTSGEGQVAVPGEKRYIAPVGPDGVQHVEVRGGDYYFDPDYIVVKANVPVEIRAIKAKGITPHTLIVKAPEAGIDFKLALSDKEYKTARFTPVKTGIYEMFCDQKLLFFKSHKDKGMHGVLEVVP